MDVLDGGWDNISGKGAEITVGAVEASLSGDLSVSLSPMLSIGTNICLGPDKECQNEVTVLDSL